MADQTVPLTYAKSPSTTDGEMPADPVPTTMQKTHPTTGPNDPVPEVPHASDKEDSGDEQTANRPLEVR